MSASGCGYNWSMQHLISNFREEDVGNANATEHSDCFDYPCFMAGQRLICRYGITPDLCYLLSIVFPAKGFITLQILFQ